MIGRTGFEIREGSRMIQERIARAEARAEEDARKQRLVVTRRHMFVAVKEVRDEVQAA